MESYSIMILADSRQSKSFFMNDPQNDLFFVCEFTRHVHLFHDKGFVEERKKIRHHNRFLINDKLRINVLHVD